MGPLSIILLVVYAVVQAFVILILYADHINRKNVIAEKPETRQP